MPDISLPGLRPDTDYMLQVRATAGEEVSEWSPLFMFHTGGDESTPSAPSGLLAEVVDRDFVFTWVKPTTNENGTVLRDFSHYEVTIKPTGKTTEFVHLVYADRYTFDYWTNFNAFNDAWEGSVDFSIKSVDKSGNKSNVPATTTISLAPPGPITNLVFSAVGTSYVATWDKPTTGSKASAYEVTLSAAGTTLTKTLEVTDTRYELSWIDNSGYFIGYKSTVTISIRARNSANQFSTAVSATASKSTPKAPVNVTWVLDGSTFTGKWDAVTQNVDNTALVDLDGYAITLTSGTKTVQFYTKDTQFTLTKEDNMAAFRSVAASITFVVAARNQTQQTGPGSTPITTGNAAPGKPATPTATSGADSVNVSWTKNTEPDVVGYEVWLAPDATSAGSLFTTVPQPASGTTVIYSHPTVGYSTAHFFYVKAVDDFGSASVASDRTGDVRPKNYGAVDTTVPASTAGLTLTSPASLTDDRSGTSGFTATWTANTEPDMAGYKLRYSTSATGPWRYEDVPYDDSAGAKVTTVTVRGLIGGTTYYASIQAYDFTANYGPWSTNASVVTATPNAIPIQPKTDGVAPTATTTPTWKTLYGAIELRWPAITNGPGVTVNGLTTYDPVTYEVHVSTTSGFAGTTVTTKAVEVNGTTAILRSLPDGTLFTNKTTYYVRIRAKDADGPGPVGPEVAVTTGEISGNDLAVNSIATTHIVTEGLDAGVLKAGTTFTDNLNVGATFTMAANGQIKSTNYDGVQPVGYSLTTNGLDIRSGTIAARALQIQEGANIVPAQYAGFEFAPSSYSGISIVNGTFAVEAANAKYETQSLRINNTSTTAECYAYLPPNIPVEPNTDYIASVYVYSTTVAQTELFIRRTDGSHSASAYTDTIANQHRRVYFTFNSGNNTWVNGRFDVNTPGATVWWDGFQIEPKTAASDLPSMWKPPGVTRIDGGIIRTGSIVSTQPNPVGDTSLPAWSLNMAGDMQINNALVRGKIVVGGANNTNVAIQSATYGTANVNQWAIRGDGSFEIRGNSGAGHAVVLDSAGLRGWNGSKTTFDLKTSDGSLTVDGNIKAGSGDFYGAVTVRGNLEVYGTESAYVIARKSGTGNWVMLDGRPSTNWAIDSATGWFRVDYDGNMTALTANIKGTITATGGSIGGFTITGDQYGSSLYAGSGTSRVQMQSNYGIWLGDNNRDSASFYVTPGGYMHSHSGDIGGWRIYNGYLQSVGGNITLNGSNGSISGLTISASQISAGTLSSMTLESPTINSSVVTGGVFRTAASGARIELRGDGGAGQGIDTIRIYNGGNGWVDLRGTMGDVNGWQGFYINGDTQIGNTQSAIYQVGKRKGNNGATGPIRVRADAFSGTTTGGGLNLSFSNAMDTAPNFCSVTMSNTGGGGAFTWWVTNLTSSGLRVNVRYRDGAVPGDGTVISGWYYAEIFV